MSPLVCSTQELPKYLKIILYRFWAYSVFSFSQVYCPYSSSPNYIGCFVFRSLFSFHSLFSLSFLRPWFGGCLEKAGVNVGFILCVAFFWCLALGWLLFNASSCFISFSQILWLFIIEEWVQYRQVTSLRTLKNSNYCIGPLRLDNSVFTPLFFSFDKINIFY